MIKLEIPGYGDITLELDYEHAPISSKNFEDLVKKGFYDGLTFHRVIKGFMIQGGCPHGTGTGGPGYTIKGEFKENGVDNPIKHTRGTLSMARAYDPNSAGSQFFIMHKDAPYLDGSYAAFGHVVEGIEVVDKIASTRTGANDRPLERIIIARAYVI
ncbi:MAG: peptidylprolyl isomerase [Bacilli bacterium]